MPTVTDETIYEISRQVLRAAGAPDDHASTVARHLANANLAGHDSHGFIRVPQYIREIKGGRIDPAARPEVVKDGPGTAKVDGESSFGQVVATFATELAIQKARRSGISLVSMFNLSHTGRIGTYAEMAAKEGMAAMMFTGFAGGSTAKNVAPFGGRERKLGTNPLSMGFPFKPEEPILLDFATSMAAEGKLRVYRARGHSLPDEWVLTKEGLPSKDPNDYYDGGSILPMGGLHGGHKGYALSFMVTLFGAAIGGLDSLDVAESQLSGSSIIVVDLEALAPLDDLATRVQNLVGYVKDTPASVGSGGVLYPGEIEANSRRQRLADGIPVEQATWDKAGDLIKEFGLEGELGHLR